MQAVSLSPLNREWFYALIIQPYKEGVERINLFFSGVNPLTFELHKLTLKERVISLISGILLMVPLINTIVWITMQTFGHPQFLSDPFHE